MRRVAIGICLLLTLFIPVEAEPTSTGGIVISEVLVSPNNENFNGTDWNEWYSAHHQPVHRIMEYGDANLFG